MIKEKKQFLCLFWALVSCLTSVQAQESAFEVLLPYTTDYSYSFCSETLDGHYLVVPGKNMVLKLSQQGDVVNELEYTIEELDSSNTRICALLSIPDDPSHHIAIAESYEQSSSGTTSNLLHIFKFDETLCYNPDSVVVVDLSEDIVNYSHNFCARFFLDVDGSVCFASNARKRDDSLCLLFGRVMPGGLTTTHFESQFEGLNQLQVCSFASTGDHYDIVLGYEIEVTPYASQPRLSYCEVDGDFNVGTIYHLSTGQQATTPLQYDNLNDSIIIAEWHRNDNVTMNWINDSVFLLPTPVFGCSHYNLTTYYGAAILKMDSGFNTVNTVFFDVFNPPAYQYKLLSAQRPIVINNDEVYFCYTTFSGYYGDPQQVAVCKLDTDLNLKWKRWYGGAQEYHTITDMIPARDGGCLLSGEGGPNPSYWTHPFPYVLKITSDGYCSLEEKGEPLLKPYAFFPNPVDDQLHMEFSPDVQPRNVELYDIQGRLVHSQGKGFEGISMSNLPSGTYTLRIVMKDGKTYTDKVVKL